MHTVFTHRRKENSRHFPRTQQSARAAVGNTHSVFCRLKKGKNMQETVPNRNYKDSVFVDLFSEDEKARENFLSLYNALHNTSLTAAE